MSWTKAWSKIVQLPTTSSGPTCTTSSWTWTRETKKMEGPVSWFYPGLSLPSFSSIHLHFHSTSSASLPLSSSTLPAQLNDQTSNCLVSTNADILDFHATAVADAPSPRLVQSGFVSAPSAPPEAKVSAASPLAHLLPLSEVQPAAHIQSPSRDLLLASTSDELCSSSVQEGLIKPSHTHQQSHSVVRQMEGSARSTAMGFIRSRSGKTGHQIDSSIDTISPSLNRRQNPRSSPCSLCKQCCHSTLQCPQYPTPELRYLAAIRLGLCFNCLHRHSGNCISHQSCKLCRSRHHTALCSPQLQQMASKARQRVLQPAAPQPALKSKPSCKRRQSEASNASIESALDFSQHAVKVIRSRSTPRFDHSAKAQAIKRPFLMFHRKASLEKLFVRAVKRTLSSLLQCRLTAPTSASISTPQLSAAPLRPALEDTLRDFCFSRYGDNPKAARFFGKPIKSIPAYRNEAYVASPAARG